MNNEDQIIQILSKKGYRITKIRKDVIKCFFDGKHSHTINEIVNHLNKKNKKVNISSIYNTIEILINEKFIYKRGNYQNKSISYEINNKNDFHFHVYEIKDNKEHLLEMPKNILDEINNFINKKIGLKIKYLKLEIYCEKSKEKNEKI